MLRKKLQADASCPLRSLSAAVLDTETTSLDVKTARVVEIGVALMVDGRMQSTPSFSSFVNPGIPIPESARMIHRISDQMVAQSPAFDHAYKSCLAFTGEALVLGYSLGFDLAVLKAEHERWGLPWKAPRFLDVRDLVRILNPPLPDFSLDKVALWLGIEIRDRHTAIGDAIVTGEILLAILSRLRAIGIRTLGEAEDACRKRRAVTDDMPTQWQEAMETPRPTRALARVDSYPYRHRVKDIMSFPPVTVDRKASLHQALNMLVARKISSLFVLPEAEGGAHGIITERDILRAIFEEPSAALSRTVASAASFPLAAVSTEDFLYSAFGRMRRKRFRHLGVVDTGGNLVGALTQRDLLRQRADDAIALTDAMDEAAGVNELAIVWRKLADAARSLVAENVDPRDIAGIISGEVCSLTARAAEIAEAEMPTPRPDGLSYAVMVLGSGGRGESLLAMDQDNAIIYEATDPAQEEECGQWLAGMAARMNAILDEVGVPFCKGGVMAMNASWRKSANEWRRHVAGWLSRSDPQDILNADIFFDALPVHGDAQLADMLRRDAIAAASQSAGFLKLIALASANPEAPLGWFGRFKLDETGRMDLKRGGIMPIFSSARVLAIKYRLEERSTASRLEALRGKADVPARQAERLLEAHKIILGCILNQQLVDIDRGIPPSSLVDPKDMVAAERDRLKWALENLGAVRDLLGDPVG